ncbi:MAG: SDR family oxidoreductase [bacterium]
MSEHRESIKKVLVTGNMGYIGSVLVPELLTSGYEVSGYDIGYYDDDCCVDEDTQKGKIHQIVKDIRDISKADVKGIDAIIHLAALSNDPLGELDSSLTEEINLNATLKLAAFAKECGVKRFVYSSSQSMYGISKTTDELDEESTEKNPLTVYARTKWVAEKELKKLCADNFLVVCFRLSTVFGASPKLRCDIVYNNLVACAYTTHKIEIKSDGTPCRPVVHVRDVCSAFLAGLLAPRSLLSGESFNVGIKDGNFTIRDLAENAQKVIPNSSVSFTNEHGTDSRTYRISFKKIYSVLKDYYKPKWDLTNGGQELRELFEKIQFTEEQFRGRTCTRLHQIKYLIDKGIIDKMLRRVVKGERY